MPSMSRHEKDTRAEDDLPALLSRVDAEAVVHPDLPSMQERILGPQAGNDPQPDAEERWGGVPVMTKASDNTGLRFGRLVGVRRLANDANGRCIWLWHCDCGREVEKLATEVRGGHRKSCGCRQGKSRNKLDWPIRRLSSQWRTYRKNASDRGLVWNLSQAAFLNHISSPCRYCGDDRASAQMRGGIDRIDNTRGYEPDNCVPCCQTCNRAKLDKTMDEWEAWIGRLAGRWVGTGSGSACESGGCASP